ncbi:MULTISPECIES: hypothetical protein [unclassified Janthinobacterium]|uniref:hypothetical protein n=1 Tax=unclassified Janthinobacterium TaxID=2610881 RepID=UPI0025B184BA|nr:MULTISPECIES: hypothetical protein [unclassified Janthinobacterium]MDN2716593.1 hypothetical protein [Janthinobacterium sp. SUN120]MDO8038799.1 hypothetical protein [Janthinobacterium sp. SUN137]
MNTHNQDNDERHDEELNALLASLPQPAPSSALDTVILADAERALQQPAAANDSADGVLRTLPAKQAPDYLQRWRVPLGLAAAVLLTVNLIGVDWFGSKPAQFPVVGEPVTQEVMPAAAPVPQAVVSSPPAQAPAPAPAPRAMAVAKSAPTAELAASPPPPPPTDMHQAMEPQAAMQAEASMQRALAKPAPVAARSAPMPPPAKLDASVWLVKIDALLKAGEGALAHEEWTAFRQAYPDYPVAEELQRRLEKK